MFFNCDKIISLIFLNKAWPACKDNSPKNPFSKQSLHLSHTPFDFSNQTIRNEEDAANEKPHLAQLELVQVNQPTMILIRV